MLTDARDDMKRIDRDIGGLRVDIRGQGETLRAHSAAIATINDEIRRNHD